MWTRSRKRLVGQFHVVRSSTQKDWRPWELCRENGSTSSSLLTVRRKRLSTIGEWAFPVAADRTWNSLPQHVTSAPSMSVFRGRLKAFLFRRYFPWTRYRNLCSARAVTVIIFGHLNRSFYLLTLLTYQLLTGSGTSMLPWGSQRDWNAMLHARHWGTVPSRQRQISKLPGGSTSYISKISVLLHRGGQTTKELGLLQTWGASSEPSTQSQTPSQNRFFFMHCEHPGHLFSPGGQCLSFPPA